MPKRRLPGEGSIYRRPDGRWVGVLDSGVVDGKRRRRYVYGRKASDVAAGLAALRGSALPVNRPPTVGEWLRAWLDGPAKTKVRSGTWHRYRSLIDHHIVPAIGNVRLDKLAPEHVEAAWTRMAAGGAASASVLQAHRVLHRALYVAQQRGHVTRNVAALVDAPALKRAEVQPYTRAQALAILRAAKGRRNAARWSVALALGLRQGEALGLGWQYVDLDAGTLTVRWAQRREPKIGLVLDEPKSDRSARRTIRMPEPLVAELRAHRLAQLEERVAASNAWFPGLTAPDGQTVDLVFRQVTGRPVDSRRDWGEWREICRVAGVPVRRLHDARHTAATLALLQGVDTKMVQQLLGHSSAQVTSDVYLHILPEVAEDAAGRIGAALWPSTSDPSVCSHSAATRRIQNGPAGSV